MKNSIKAVGLTLFAGILTYGTEARADRVRTCNFLMVDTVSLVDANREVVAEFDVDLSGQTAGFHGGVQANTARARARDRFNTCRQRWVLDDAPSLDIPECNNGTARSGNTNDVFRKSDGENHTEYLLAELRGSVCQFVRTSSLDLNSLALILTRNVSSTNGDNRCGSSRSDNFDRRFLTVASALCAE